MERRTFLAGAVAALAASPPVAARAVSTSRRWGLQLFTVGVQLEQDFEGTLRQVAAFGYREVETIGSFGRDPHWLRAQLDRFGLISPSQHIASDEIYGSFGAWTRKEISTEQNRENYERLLATDKALDLVRDGIAKAKVLGQTYVTWPILMPRMLADRAIVSRYISLFNEAGKLCRDAGLVFSFHNHAREFARLDGAVIYDLILAGTDPRLVQLEMDLYWFTKAGIDPVTYLRDHPGRYFGCHLKDMDAAGEMTTVGQGKLDLPRLLGEVRHAGIKHVFVEYDRSEDPLKAIRESMAYLKMLS